MSKIQDDAARAAEYGARLDNLLHLVDNDGRTTLSRLVDAMAGQPGAVATDGDGGGGATAWCDEHEREVHLCHRRCRVHDVLLDRCRSEGHRCYLAHECTGVPVKVTDPTGEAASVPDPARADLAEAERQLAHGAKALAAALRILEPWAPRQPSEAERQSLHAENTPGCESCARVTTAEGARVWEPPHPRLSGPTTVDGPHGPRLAKAMLLCRWCYEHVGTRGCLPSLTEVRAHHAGQKVKCPHPVRDDWSARAKDKARRVKTKRAKPAPSPVVERPRSRAERLADRAERRASGRVGGSNA